MGRESCPVQGNRAPGERISRTLSQRLTPAHRIPVLPPGRSIHDESTQRCERRARHDRGSGRSAPARERHRTPLQAADGQGQVARISLDEVRRFKPSVAARVGETWRSQPSANPAPPPTVSVTTSLRLIVVPGVALPSAIHRSVGSVRPARPSSSADTTQAATPMEVSCRARHPHWQPIAVEAPSAASGISEIVRVTRVVVGGLLLHAGPFPQRYGRSASSVALGCPLRC